MVRTMVRVSFTITVLAVSGVLTLAQDTGRKTGNLTGELKSTKPSPNGKNTIIEVLAPGEEKARSYRVLYDPKAKGPIPTVLEAVRKAKVGDRVQLEWVDTGEGLAMKAFQVLKKTMDDEKKQPTLFLGHEGD